MSTEGICSACANSGTIPATLAIIILLCCLVVCCAAAACRQRVKNSTVVPVVPAICSSSKHDGDRDETKTGIYQDAASSRGTGGKQIDKNSLESGETSGGGAEDASPKDTEPAVVDCDFGEEEMQVGYILCDIVQSYGVLRMDPYVSHS